MRPYSLGSWVLATVVTALVFGATTSWAQNVESRVNGTVTDPAGNAVPGVDIALKNIDTGTERHVTSSGTGTYFISSVPPARYTLTVTKEGFRTYVVSEFALQVNEIRTIDAQLAVGSVNQTIEVKASALAINTTDSTIGTVIQHQDVVEIPLNGRNFTELITLAPGVSPIQTAQQTGFTVTGGISPAVNGMRAQMNNFTLDGVDNNMRFTNTYAVSPPPDAIEEFKVASHQTDADVSLAAGANINLITRSGTNGLHGAVWEFLRNNVLDARNYFDNFFNSPSVAFRQNQFGFFVGGPVIIPHVIDGRKSRTYFSTDYEGFRSSRNQVTQATVPDSAERNGDFSELLGPAMGTDCLGRPVLQNQIYDPLSGVANSNCPGGVVFTPFPNNVIPSDRISPIANDYLQFLYPLPNRSGTPNLLLSQATTQNAYQYMIRGDHDLSDSQRVFGRVSRYYFSVQSPGALPANTLTDVNSGLNIGAHYTKIFSPTLLLDVMFGYNRAGIPFHNNPLSPAFDQAVGSEFFSTFPSGNIPASQSLSGSRFSSASFVSYELSNPDSSYQGNVDLRKVKGRHNMSTGFHILHFISAAGAEGTRALTYVPQSTGLPDIAGTGEALASFYLGVPTDSFLGTITPFTEYTNIYNAYFGDTWKMTPKFTINLGMQYVYAMPPLVNGNQISDFDFQKAITQPNATDFTFAYLWCSKNPVTGAPPNCPRPSILEPVRTHFLPRIGLAYSPFSNIVLRTGFGIFVDYNNNIDQASIKNVGGEWPYSITRSITAQNLAGPGPLNPPVTLDNPFPFQAQGAPSPRFSVNPRNRDPYAMEWNLGIEKMFRGNLKLSMDYVGSAARKLIVADEENIAPAGPGPIDARRPLHNTGSIFVRNNIGNSSYNSLQVKLERAFSGGLTFRNSYTWSKSLDILSDANATSLRELPYPYDRRFTYGPSDFDITNINVTSFVYDLPFGRNKKFASHVSGPVNAVVGGWESSGVVTLRSGTWYSLFTGTDIANTGGEIFGPMEPLNQIAPLNPAGFHKSRAAWFDTSSVALPAFGTFGNMSSNDVRGPWYSNFDLAFMKNFNIAENLKLQFRSELFNAFNHTNFNNPDVFFTDPTFGQILSAYPSREIQFALKLSW